MKDLQLPRYRSHKVVGAARITAVDPQHNTVTVEMPGDASQTVTVPHDFFGRGIPTAGAYLVQYEPDGYLSWSPAATFEDGYAPVEG